MFFIPVTLGGTSSIPLDHLVTGIRNDLGPAVPYYALLVILLGAVYPFVRGTWKKNRVELVFSILKVLGLITAIMLVFDFGPKWLFDPDLGPFLFEKLVIPVGLLVPVGSVFLAMLVGYGLLEFVGVFLRPVMRRI
jgi:nucleoside recognition membrane protein YjiH